MQKDIAKYQFAVKCGHIEADDGRELYERYDQIFAPGEYGYQTRKLAALIPAHPISLSPSLLVSPSLSPAFFLPSPLLTFPSSFFPPSQLLSFPPSHLLKFPPSFFPPSACLPRHSPVRLGRRRVPFPHSAFRIPHSAFRIPFPPSFKPKMVYKPYLVFFALPLLTPPISSTISI